MSGFWAFNDYIFNGCVVNQLNHLLDHLLYELCAASQHMEH